jgi:RimJ/RimL family protein N-acetyltransferase
MTGPILVGSILYNADDMVADMVFRRINGAEQPFVNFKALGVVRDGKLLGGAVFSNARSHRGRIFDIEVSVAFDHPGWCTRAILRDLFTYPFVQMGCARMTGIVARSNKPSRRLLKGLGFKEEGVIELGWDGARDAIVYGLRRDRCRWLREPHGQQENTRSAAAA